MRRAAPPMLVFSLGVMFVARDLSVADMLLAGVASAAVITVLVGLDSFVGELLAPSDGSGTSGPPGR